MAHFKYDITIQAPTEEEADTKLKSLAVLSARLNTKELERLADIVKNDPAKLAMAKKALGV